MEELSIADQRLKMARDSFEHNYKAQITKFDRKENCLNEQLYELTKKKLETTKVNGSVESSQSSLVLL